MKTDLATAISQNKFIIISALVAIIGLAMRTCQAVTGPLGLPMCGEPGGQMSDLFMSHAHCVGCYVAASGFVGALAAIISRGLKSDLRRQSI